MILYCILGSYCVDNPPEQDTTKKTFFGVGDYVAQNVLKSHRILKSHRMFGI